MLFADISFLTIVDEIGPFLTSLSFFIQLMFQSIYGPICKHLLFLSESLTIFNFKDRFKQNKVANQKASKNPKSLKKNKIKIALQKIHSNSFFQFFPQMFTYHPVESTQHQLNKN